MARHAVVDLAQVVNARYDYSAPARLSSQDLADIRSQLARKGLRLREGGDADQKLSDLRALYEPYAHGIAKNLFIPLPPWIRRDSIRDNWRAGPWDAMVQARALEHANDRRGTVDDHF
jgi:hypothetical protein